MQGVLAEAGAQDFEVELGLQSPETTPVAQTAKGPRAGRPKGDRETDQLNEEATSERPQIERRPDGSSEPGFSHGSNGQPKPAFYLAVLLVVVGLGGYAFWRYGGLGLGSGTGQISRGGAGAGEGRRRSARQLRDHDGQGIQLRRRPQAARRSRGSPATSRWPIARCALPSTCGRAGARSSTRTTASSRARSGRRPAARTSSSSSS